MQKKSEIVREAVVYNYEECKGKKLHSEVMSDSDEAILKAITHYASKEFNPINIIVNNEEFANGDDIKSFCEMFASLHSKKG